MNNTYKINHKVKFSEVDVSYNMTPDSIVTYLQDMTGTHSLEMGVDADNMRKKSNAFWIITKIKLKIYSRPRFDDVLEFETWPTTVDRIRFERDYTVSRNGEMLVACRSQWCVLDCDTFKLRRTDSVCYPHDMLHREDRSGAGEFVRSYEKTEDADLAFVHKIRFTELDPNGHTNNVSYLRMALNTFELEEMKELEFDEIQISFASQTYFGDEVKLYRKKTENGYYVEGKKDGAPVFDCIITVK